MQVAAAFILCVTSPHAVRAEENATERAIQLANQGKILANQQKILKGKT